MGYSTAYGLAESLDLTKAISVHFQSNCYPPVPQFMVSSAKQAVIAVADGDLYRSIDLPDFVSFRDEKTVSATVMVEILRLNAFVSALMDSRGDEPEDD